MKTIYCNRFQMIQISLKKIILIENTWHYWLINYIPEPIAKIIGSFEDKI